MNKITLNHRTIYLRKFTTHTSAMNAYNASRCHERIVLGDDGMYWLVLNADATRLEKAGYEVIA